VEGTDSGPSVDKEVEEAMDDMNVDLDLDDQYWGVLC
jgi:hypothetical protein